MNSLIVKVLDEGNCGKVTNRGEEACEDVRKRQVCIPSPPGHLHVKAARLRTETPYKAGSTRRVSPTSRSRFQLVVQVNGELVQRSITLLSGEICIAPTSKHLRLKGWNEPTQVGSGCAEVSRGRSTDSSIPTKTGRAKQ